MQQSIADNRLNNLTEEQVIPHTFEQFFKDKNIGFVCSYIPQFSMSNSLPIIIKHNSNILSEKQFNVLAKRVTKIDLSMLGLTADNNIAYMKGIKILGMPLPFYGIVVGYFIFFSKNIINKYKIKKFTEYCEDSIVLRKKAVMFGYIGQLGKKLPSIKDETFFDFIGEIFYKALKCAEIIVFKRSMSDPRKFITEFSQHNSSIEVPEGQNILWHCINSRNVIVENDVKNKSNRPYLIHNYRFFELNNYRSFLACAFLNDFPQDTFAIFCFYKRSNAISSIDIEMFKTLCLVLEGICSRDFISVNSKNNYFSIEQDQLNKQCLLIADVMHDATEDLVVARNNLSVVHGKTIEEKEKIEGTKKIIEDIIQSSEGFKVHATKSKAGYNSLISKKQCLRSLVKGVMEKYSQSGEYKNIDFKNKIDPNFEVNVIGNSVKRAIDNAIKNSVYHLRDISHRRREIQVSAIRVADAVVLEIRDNGIGVSPELIDKIRELRFSTTGGMGHGMSIIEATALIHGGSMEIESEQNKYFSVKMIITINS